MYALAFDPRSRLLTITGEGLWSMATLAAFSAEVLAYGAALKIRHGSFAVLNDVRNMPVQLSTVASGLELLMEKGTAITTAPIATVAGGALPKMQIERVIRGDHTRVFLTMEDARDWLAEHWPPARATPNR